MPPSLSKRIWDNLPDADDLFAYDTVKEVRVLDRRLGLVYYSVFNLVLFYILVYVFAIEKRYQDREKAVGWVVSTASNPPIPDKEPHDLFDISASEQDAIFLPTRILRTTGQENKNTKTDADFCASPLHKCTTAADCEIENAAQQKGDVCTAGTCMRRQWCPAECNPGAGCATTTETLVDPLAYEIRFATSVHFHKFGMDVSTTEVNDQIVYPKAKANTYKLSDLLRMANLKVEDIQKNGAVVLVSLVFNCEMDEEACVSSLESVNVDTKTGFNYAKPLYYSEGGVERRDLVRTFGVRVVLQAIGDGAKMSFSMIVLQVSSAIALLAVARTAADFFLEHVVPERRHYIEQKVLQPTFKNPSDV